MQVEQGGLAYTLVHPDELRRRLAKGEAFAIVDARSEPRYRSSGETVVGALRLRPEELWGRLKDVPRGRSLLLVADLDRQVDLALDLLRSGYTDVYLLDGGFDAYLRAGGPTEPAR
jgi:3-mercaptopyruvate sulfurtransferase SseA